MHVDVDDIQSPAKRVQLLFNYCVIDSDLLYYGASSFSTGRKR